MDKFNMNVLPDNVVLNPNQEVIELQEKLIQNNNSTRKSLHHNSTFLTTSGLDSRNKNNCFQNILEYLSQYIFFFLYALPDIRF